jgi:hypothetical protein
MPSPPDLRDAILDAGKTDSRVTVFLGEHVPAEI